MSEPNGSLDLDFSYTLESQVTEDAKVEIEHELDYQLYYRDKDLPRFTRITVFAPDNTQPRDVEGPELKRLCPNGVLKLQLGMPPKATGRAAKIVTHRREVTHVPGSYNRREPMLATVSISLYRGGRRLTPVTHLQIYRYTSMQVLSGSRIAAAGGRTGAADRSDLHTHCRR